MRNKKIAGIKLSVILFFLVSCCGLCFIVYITTPTKSSVNTVTDSSSGNPNQQDVNGDSIQKVTETPTCIQDKLNSKKCSTCKMATATYTNLDCSKYNKEIEDVSCTATCPKCNQDEVKEKSCVGCNVASGTFLNADCSTYIKDIDDSSCSNLCPAPEPPYIAPAPTYTAPSYACNCSRTCEQMISCDEAYYQLNQCGCNKRDNDNDGVPCESIC